MHLCQCELSEEIASIHLRLQSAFDRQAHHPSVIFHHELFGFKLSGTDRTEPCMHPKQCELGEGSAPILHSHWLSVTVVLLSLVVLLSVKQW